MRVPIDASDFFGIELHFLVERSAQRMEHGAFDRASQRLGVDYQPAVVRAHKPPHPNVASSAIHFDLGNLRNDRLATERVRDSTAAENVCSRHRFRRRTSVPTISFRRCLDHGDGARSFEPGVLGGLRAEEL